MSTFPLPAAPEMTEVPHILCNMEQHGDGERVMVGRPLVAVGDLGTPGERATVGDPPREPGEVLGAGDRPQARVGGDEAVPEARQVGHTVSQSREVGVTDQFMAQV